MSHSHRVRYQRLLREAEGYLELGLPQMAIEALEKIVEPGTFKNKRLHLLGEAYRAQNRFAEAIEVLEASVGGAPSNLDLYLALGWCYKRVHRLDRAIESLQKGLEIDPKQAILHYNLACYWTLAGNKDQALSCLSEALRRHPEYREMIADEHDFDALRNDPDFQSLVSVTV